MAERLRHQFAKLTFRKGRIGSNPILSAKLSKFLKREIMYIKPSKTFKLSKTTKRRMATIVDPVELHAYKNAMIQAQLASEVVVRHKERSDRLQGGAQYQTNDTGTASTSA